jgi:hypothetical protein
VPAGNETGSQGFPAWPFGLALLAIAVWFALRRRKQAGGTVDTIEPEERTSFAAERAPDVVPEPAAPPPASLPPPSLPPALPEPPKAEPVEPAAAAQPHPGLSVKVADLARRAAPPPAPAPPQPAIARYDAFGRPLAATPKTPPPAPPPPTPAPPKPKPQIVRYDALGMPIRD